MKHLIEKGFAAMIVAFVCIGTGIGVAIGQTAADGFKPTANGQIFKIQNAHGRWTYIMGTFTTVDGIARNRMARFTNAGILDSSYNPAPNSNVQDFAPLGDDIVAVGNFTNIGGLASNGLARLNISGNNTGTLNTTFDIAPAAVAIQPDGKILVGGAFNVVNGSSAAKLVRLNSDGSIDNSFAAVINNTVWGITVDPDGKILINGQFTNVSGQSRPNFARLNSNGSLDTGFMAGAGLAGGNDHTFYAAVQPDRKIVVVGRFTRFGDFNTPRNRIVRLMPNGDVDGAFSANLDSYATEVRVQPDMKILVAGYFTTVNGVTRGGLARLNSDGSLDQTFAGNTGTAGAAGVGVGTLDLLYNGCVLIAGSFTQFNGTTGFTGIGMVYPDGTIDADTNPGFSGPAATLVSLPGGKTLAGGGFTNVGGLPRRGMVRLNSNGSVDAAFADPNLTGWVYSIGVQSDGKYIAGGDFTSAAGGPRAKLARINPNGTIDNTFAPTFNTNAWISDVAIQNDGKIIIAGSFTSVNGTAKSNIARLNSNGTLDTSFTGAADQGVLRVAITGDGKVLIGGYFANVNGAPKVGIARLNSTGTTDTTFSTTLSGTIEPYVDNFVFDKFGRILIAGSFTTVNGAARTYINRLNADGTNDGTFTPPTLDSTVRALSVDLNQRIFIAGRWTTINGVSRPGVVELGLNGAFARSLVASGGNDVLSMTHRSDGKILFSGYFTTASGLSRNHFAAVRTGYGSLSFMQAGPTSMTWRRGSAEVELNRVIFERSTDGVNWSYLGDGTRTLYSEWSLNIPNADQTSYIRARGFHGDFSNSRSMYEQMAFVVKPPVGKAPFDFDGDGKTDVSVFRAGLGQWWYLRSSDGGNRAFTFGSETDTIVPADFTGDGKTDVAFWRPSTGEWFVLRSEDSTFFAFPFGAAGDIPSPADFDGDGRADATVYRPSMSTWFTLRSSDGQFVATQFGVSSDKPVPADYDGDGKADVAIFRPTGGTGGGEWWYLRSSDGTYRAFGFGSSTDLTVPGDYTGDGKADIAFFRPSTGEWFVLRSEDSSFFAFPWGTSGDIPAPGDYDGDGRTDAAVFRPSNATWFALRSTAGPLFVQFGITTDRPLPNAYVR